jgi:MinD superfamily P-loop ATPase
MSNKYLQNSQISNKKKHNYVNILCPKCGSNRKTRILKVVEKDNLFIVNRECSQCKHLFLEEKVIDRHTNRTGYVYMVFPRMDAHGNIYFRGGQEHVFIWEKNFGTLPVGFIVHHVNGNKTDNRIENLIAIPKSSHTPNTQYEALSMVTCPHCNKEFRLSILPCR